MGVSVGVTDHGIRLQNTKLGACIVLGQELLPDSVESKEMTRMDPLTCLAVALFFETRGEPQEGMEAVANVIINRVEDSRYPRYGVWCRQWEP